MRYLLALLVAAGAVAGVARSDAAPPPTASSTPSELDAFMADVLARRDDNWRKLQQYVLDERERAMLLGPGGLRLYGLARDYTWYIRDGVFVRSPLRFDGVAVGDEERLKYEREWLERERRRDEERAKKGDAPPASVAATAGADADTLARLTREPQFVSMAYFLRFKFEPGHYAFAGRENYEGHAVYKIEYYPSRLFADDRPDDDPHGAADKTDEDARMERAMNKVALVTLWVEPTAKQILRYTFENLGMDFLPGRWLVRVDDVQASMRMVEAFPGVWLPQGIEGAGRLTLASGSYTFEYHTLYERYREATVKARIR